MEVLNYAATFETMSLNTIIIFRLSKVAYLWVSMENTLLWLLRKIFPRSGIYNTKLNANIIWVNAHYESVNHTVPYNLTFTIIDI